MQNSESQADPELVPPLDPTLLTLAEDEKAFLRDTISLDENLLREHILDIQKQCVLYFSLPFGKC